MQCENLVNSSKKNDRGQINIAKCALKVEGIEYYYILYSSAPF